LIPMTARRFFREGVSKLRLWKIGIVDKKLPNIESNYLYSTKKKDTLNLLMDSKGFIHKLRIPKLVDMLEFLVWKKHYKNVTNHLELPEGTKEKIKEDYENESKLFLKDNPEYDVFFIPDPHESLEIIARQVQKGAIKFMAGFMERHQGLIIWGATIFACVMIFVMTLIFSSKIWGV